MIGSRIRRLRTRHSLSQQGLADKTGLSKSRIGRIERENVSLTFDEMKLISHALGIDVDKLAKVETLLPPPSLLN